MSEDKNDIPDELNSASKAWHPESVADFYRDLVENHERISRLALGAGATDALQRVLEKDESARRALEGATFLPEGVEKLVDQASQFSGAADRLSGLGDIAERAAAIHEGAAAAVKDADDVQSALSGHAKRLREFERLAGLSQEAASAMESMTGKLGSTDEHFLAKLREPASPFSEGRYFPVENAYQNEQRKHQSELVEILKAQNERTGALIQLNESAYKSAHKTSKWTIGLTSVSTVLALFIAGFTVFSYLYPPQMTVTEGQSAVAIEKNTREPEPDNLAEGKVIGDQPVSEETAQPQPPPTAAHAPVDNAPSSSDQSEP